MIALAKRVRHFLFLSVRAGSYRLLRILNPEYQGARAAVEKVMAAFVAMYVK